MVTLTIAMFIAFPFTFSGYNLYLVNVLVLAFIGSAALNLLSGNADQVSLGNAAFLGIGAFTCVIAATVLHWPFIAAVVAAVIVSGFIGLSVGMPALRVRGLYLLLATLAIHYIFFYGGNLYQQDTVGPGGFLMPAADIFGWKPTTQLDWYFVLAACSLFVLFVTDNLLRGRAGRAWALIRFREPVAAALGVPVTRYKVLAFVISSMMIGFQGALTAYFIGTVSIEQWDYSTAVAYVAMTVIGGLGSIAGSVVGAAVVILLPVVISNFLATTPDIPSVIVANAGPVTTFTYGLFIALMLLIAPRGLAGTALAELPRLDVWLSTRRQQVVGRLRAR